MIMMEYIYSNENNIMAKYNHIIQKKTIYNTFFEEYDLVGKIYAYLTTEYIGL